MDGNQRVWVAGMLHQLDGSKALVNFPETDGNGTSENYLSFLPFSEGWGGV